MAQVNEMLTLQLRELKERIEEMDREGRGLQSRIPSRKIIENVWFIPISDFIYP